MTPFSGDPYEQIMAELDAKARRLEKELSDTKAKLQRAYDGIEHYKEKWQKVLELNAELQKQIHESKVG